MLSIVTFEPSAKGSIHSHPEEQWGILLEGSGTRTQDDVEHLVEQGDFWPTPGNVTRGFKAGARGAKILDVFSPPREAYRKTGSGFTDDPGTMDKKATGTIGDSDPVHETRVSVEG